MSFAAFDTYAYIKRLKEAGFSEQQTEAQSELQIQVLTEVILDNLATKKDIEDIKTSIKVFKSDVEARFSQVASEFIEVKSEIKLLSKSIEFTHKSITDKAKFISWLIGSMGGLIAILVGMRTLFPNLHF